MNTQDWNDLLSVLEAREVALRQLMEDNTAKGRSDLNGVFMTTYRKVCRLQVKLETYIAEASKV